MDIQQKPTWSNLLSSYTYSDIGLVPRKRSFTNSRSEINTTTQFCDINLSIPLIVAPMPTLVGPELAYAVWREGCRACLPKHDSIQVYQRILEKEGDPTWAIPSIGINDNYLTQTTELYKMGCRHILINVANAYNERVWRICNILKKNFPDMHIITGNIASEEAYVYLWTSEISAVRVGIGNGSACTTSVATGVGLGQATTVRRIANTRREMHLRTSIIADGGIKTPGCMAKALALGADIIMTGSIFAGCNEAHTNTYAGEASDYVKGLIARSTEYIEGASFDTRRTSLSVANIIAKYKAGLQSAMSYMGAEKIQQFIGLEENCFARLSDASKIERTAHYQNQP